MPKRSRIAKDIVVQLERVGLQIIHRGADDAHIRGQFGPRQQDALLAVLPELKAHWRDVVKVLAGRDENEAAAAALRIISGEENPAAILGRRGGLKGGKARAAKLSKRQLSASARKAALARWGKS